MNPDPNIPVQVGTEMREGRPWWKVCCSGCCLFVVLLVVGGVMLWRGIGLGGPTRVTSLPPNFPPSITLYRLKDAKSIDYFPGKDRDRLFNTLITPFRAFGGVFVTSGSSVTRLQQVDNVTVRWERLPGTRDDLYNFYLPEFKRNGFVIESRRDEATMTDVVLAHRDDIQVQLQVQDLPDIDGVDSITLVVDYANQN